MAEICGRGLGPVAAMIVGVSRVARGVQGSRQPGVAGAVFREAVGDLYDCPRTAFRQPTPPQEGVAIVGAKVEFAA